MPILYRFPFFNFYSMLSYSSPLFVYLSKKLLFLILNITFCIYIRFGLECLFKFLQLLHAAPAAGNENVNNNYLKYVEPVEQYIQFHYRDRDSIMEFVKQIGIERSYFYRIFKMHTGKSLEKYLISFRIQQAKIMLCDSDMPIDETASIVGYDNYIAFYKSFKKLVGKSPSDYRNQRHKEKMLENENNLFQEMR